MSAASGLYWELKSLLPFGLRYNKNSKWIPNTRVRTKNQRNITEPFNRRKMVFMSHVRKEKGIDELLEAFKILGDEYDIDIYGTLMGYKLEDLDGHYKGVLPSDQVTDTLSKYSLLLLPTWKEGYPGIIIEAFGCGLPIIASNVGGIPEMIEDGKNGLICEAHNPQSIVDAIKRAENVDYTTLSKNALASFDLYDGNIVNLSIIHDLEKACKK